jgi:hypothetical protein
MSTRRKMRRKLAKKQLLAKVREMERKLSPVYAIQKKDGWTADPALDGIYVPLRWSNHYGWVHQGFTKFTSAEMHELRLPGRDCEWVML